MGVRRDGATDIFTGKERVANGAQLAEMDM